MIPATAWQPSKRRWSGATAYRLGIIYRTELPTYEEQVPGLEEGPVATRKLTKALRG